MTTKILLVDDHQIMLEGLCALLKDESDMEVAGQATDGRTAVRMARDLVPDVVIVDISMPDLNGIDSTRQIVAHSPKTKVIALSMHSDKRFVAQMLKAGACGYLLKEAAFEELANAVRTVTAGRTYLSPEIASTVVEDYVQHLAAGESMPAPVLTGREREVLQLLTEGKSTKEAASLLHISVKTIETHRSQVMHKLGIYTMAELTKYALREGLTTL